jgi:hypothetical protein
MLLFVIVRLFPGGEPRPSIHPSRIEEMLQSDNAENVLAAGGRVKLSRSGVYEFELIPGISDTLAFKLDQKKTILLDRARSVPAPKRAALWEEVHGVGAKTALKLASFFEIAE